MDFAGTIARCVQVQVEFTGAADFTDLVNQNSLQYGQRCRFLIAELIMNMSNNYVINSLQCGHLDSAKTFPSAGGGDLNRA